MIYLLIHWNYMNQHIWLLCLIVHLILFKVVHLSISWLSQVPQYLSETMAQIPTYIHMRQGPQQDWMMQNLMGLSLTSWRCSLHLVVTWLKVTSNTLDIKYLDWEFRLLIEDYIVLQQAYLDLIIFSSGCIKLLVQIHYGTMMANMVSNLKYSCYQHWPTDNSTQALHVGKLFYMQVTTIGAIQFLMCSLMPSKYMETPAEWEVTMELKT